MLVNFRRILEEAQKERYAIGAFNMTAIETAMAIVTAAEKQNSPVILQLSEKSIDYFGFDLALGICRHLAEQAKVPVCVHLDHGKKMPLVDRALDSGFSSIMADLSKFPANERIKLGRDIVQRAHHKSITVELEEDSIGGKEDYVSGEVKYSNPKRAASFVKETGCDAFAVAIGSAHGKPMPDEKLDLDLLREIRRVVTVPLVLHGASSTPPDITREAISRGICKINIDTDLRLAYSQKVRQALADPEVYDPRDYLKEALEAVMQVVEEKIKMFGSNNKAS